MKCACESSTILVYPIWISISFCLDLNQFIFLTHFSKSVDMRLRIRLLLRTSIKTSTLQFSSVFYWVKVWFLFQLVNSLHCVNWVNWIILISSQMLHCHCPLHFDEFKKRSIKSFYRKLNPNNKTIEHQREFWVIISFSHEWTHIQ